MAPAAAGVGLASGASCAVEAAALLAGGDGRARVTEAAAVELLRAAVGKGNVQLVRSVLAAMRRALAEGAPAGPGGAEAPAGAWPPITNGVQKAVIGELACQLLVSDAVEALLGVKSGGVPDGGEVPFGDIVVCPLDSEPLAVVQPQQRPVQTASCAECRYGYRLVTGAVSKIESESLDASEGPLEALSTSLSTLNITQGRWGGELALRHAFVVTGSDGQDRAFDACTPSDEVPARVGDRVTVVCAVPDRAADGREDTVQGRVLAARAPGRLPNEPMTLQNHTTGRRHGLLRPPTDFERFTTTALAASVLLVPLAGAAGSLLSDVKIDVAMLGESAAALAAGAAAGNLVVRPRLRQIGNESEMDFVAANQSLLKQYTELQDTIRSLERAGEEEVKSIARLQQLENKMRSVSSPGAAPAERRQEEPPPPSPSYNARLERVVGVRADVAARLESIIELVSSYGRICSMIEIEVEMSTGVSGAGAAVRSFTNSVDEELLQLRQKQEEVVAQSQASEDVERIFSDGLP